MKPFREYLKNIRLNKIKKVLAIALLSAGLAANITLANNKIENYAKTNENQIERMAENKIEQKDVDKIAKDLTQPATQEELEKSFEQVAKKAKELSLKISKELKNQKMIPQNFKQAGYSATGYGEKGFHMGMKEKATKISPKTDQEKVHKMWKDQGLNYKDGIAIIKDKDGDERFLVALTDTFGKVGDRINFKFSNGDTIKCMIADTKDRKDDNWTDYGHKVYDNKGNEQINIIEFEVDRNKWNKTKWINTEGWNLPFKDKIDGKRNNIVSWYNIDEKEKGKDNIVLAMK